MIADTTFFGKSTTILIPPFTNRIFSVVSNTRHVVFELPRSPSIAKMERLNSVQTDLTTIIIFGCLLKWVLHILIL